MNGQLSFLPDVGHSHRGDPNTSREAAADNAPRIGTQRWKVLRSLLNGPLSAEEIARALAMPSGVSGNSAAKRLSELKRAGLATATGARRRTRMGSMAEVYEITPKGRQATK